MLDRSPYSWKLRVVIAIAAALMLVPTNAVATDWPMFRLDPTHSGVVDDEGPGALHVLWEYPTPAEVNGQAAVVDGRVYFVDEDGILYCLGAADGRVTIRSSRGKGSSGRRATTTRIWPMRFPTP
jgi:outer membrane protein assembly factor BamB